MANDFVYSDIDRFLTVRDSGQVLVHYDEDAVIQSLRNIIATSAGERVRSPFGGSLLPLLFEPMDEYIADDIQRELERVITENEPRVTIQSIIVRANHDNNSIDVQINVRINKLNRLTRFNTSLRSFAT